MNHTTLGAVALTMLLLAPSTGSAQAVTTTWKMRMAIPEAARSQMPGGPEVFDARVTLTTDGDRLALQFDPGPELIAATPEMDISSARIQMVLHSGGDSVTVALIFPPEAADMMGGGLGMRIDAAIPDSGMMPGVNVDSIMQANEGSDRVEAVNTGVVAQVGGFQCEEWLITMLEVTEADSTPSRMRMCVAEESPPNRSINDVWLRLAARFGASEETMRAGARRWFGDREMVAIRMVMGDAEEIVFELESSEPGTNPAYFTIPDGLTPFPVEMFTGMVKAQMEQENQQGP